jgi:PAS domain S-box-containing protein
MRDFEERHGSDLDDVEGGIITIDETSTMQLVNSAAARIFGYSIDEMTGRSLTMLMPERSRKAHLHSLARYLTTGVKHIPWSGVELEARRKDGGPVRIEISFGESTVGDRRVFTGVVRHAKGMDGVDASSRQLRALVARMEAVREEERRRIAGEIHDELGQGLTILKLELASLQPQIARLQPTGESIPIVEKLHASSTLVDTIMLSVRNLVNQLRPAVLDHLGFVEALQWQTEDFQSRTGVLCHFSSRIATLEPSPNNSLAIYRILQEALTNVARHARATDVEVTLAQVSGAVVLDVYDNGCGISPATDHASSPGLLGMQERARFLGGALSIRRGQNGGTKVTLSIDIDRFNGRHQPA